MNRRGTTSFMGLFVGGLITAARGASHPSLNVQSWIRSQARAGRGLVVARVAPDSFTGQAVQGSDHPQQAEIPNTHADNHSEDMIQMFDRGGHPAPVQGVRQEEQRQLAPADELFSWGISLASYPWIYFGDWSSSSEVNFQFGYTGTIVAGTKYLSTTLFRADCKTPASVTALALTTPPFVDTYNHQYNVYVDVLQSTIASTPEYSTQVDATKATISFCIRVDYMDASSGSTTSVNFNEQVVNINVDLSGGYFFLSGITSRNPATSANDSAAISCHVKAYFCDSNATMAQLATYTQGSTMTVCITVDDIDASLYHVVSVVSMQVNQNKQSGGNSDQSLIILNEQPMALSDMACAKGVCVVRHQLESKFFDEANPNPLLVSGVAACALGVYVERPPVSAPPVGSKVVLVNSISGHFARERFGDPMALANNMMAVGAIWYNNYYGAAYVYTIDTSSHQLGNERLLLPSNPGTNRNQGFGSDVAISGNVVAVSALGYGSVGAGAVYVFRLLADGSNNFVQEAELYLAADYSSWGYGWSISLDGGTLLVGSPQEANYKGAVYLHEYDSTDTSGNKWPLKARISPPASSEVGFGYGVAIDSKRMVIGGGGRAYVYGQDIQGVWQLAEELQRPAGYAGYKFGNSIDLKKSIIVVGSYDFNYYQGAAFVYEYSISTNGWGPPTMLVASDGVANDNFGNAVAIEGNLVVVGAVRQGNYKGAAYLFAWSSSSASWSQVEKLTVDGVEEYFGKSVAIHDQLVAVSRSDSGRGSISLYSYGG